MADYPRCEGKAPSSPSRQRRGLASAPAAKPLLSRRGQRRGGGSPGLGVGISRYNSSVLKLLQCEQAASDPAWPIVFDPRSGSLHARKPIKLLLRAVRPCHQDETAAGLRRKNLEGGLMFDCCHFHDFSNHPTNRGLAPVPIQIGAQTSLARPGTWCDRGPETQREPQFQCATGWLGAANRSGLLAKQTVQPALSSLRFWHQEGLQAGQRFWAHPNVYPGPISLYSCLT